ncbi:LuxR C-terminal-related transcriptional regulator [Pseudohoeflea coraliihabitans]|uniref:LuxR C-terminal-related transcriptional regulator n=1 Tax=Pseudohoeflea coraliihabitans TaxID=2860393 RepID=A0ABS6WMA4_9HYPH|nr:LuxR C-terminal-related transcriptional regulator [Pseudohoeflea sp. DP4N28-3]
MRLAKILAPLSMATDMSAGNPPGTSVAASVIAVRIGRRMGLSEADLSSLYYTGFLRFIGCTSTSSETAQIALGDELTGYLALTRADPADPDSVRAELEAIFAPDRPLEERRELIEMCVGMGPELMALGQPHCRQAVALARRLPVPEDVMPALARLECRWDDQHPIHPPGPEVMKQSLLVEFAAVAELHRRAGGLVSMVEVAKARRGGQFDPLAVDIFLEDPRGITQGLEQGGEWDAFLREEPAPHVLTNAGGMREVAKAFADFTDLKSVWFTGHSRQVAGLAFQGAVDCLDDEAECQAIFDSGLLHDIGRNAVPNGIWDKCEALNPIEQAQADSATFHTEQVLRTTEFFATLCDTACSVNERADGSGTHRRTRLSHGGPALLAAANLFQELTHDQPTRGALSSGEAAEMLLAEVHAGRLPRRETRHVLDAAGETREAQKVWPDGITNREAEVLRQVSLGKANKEIARILGVSPKTVDNHLQNLYPKIGADSRTAAALYAMEMGLFDF